MASKMELVEMLEARDRELATVKSQMEQLQDAIGNRDKVVEDIIKKRYPPQGADFRKVVVLATKDDMIEASEFLDSFEMHYPTGLARIHLGFKAMLEEWDKTE